MLGKLHWMHSVFRGEHGGEQAEPAPPLVKFCRKLSLTYVSCSPFRVPVARLAAAHAALKHGGGAAGHFEEK